MVDSSSELSGALSTAGKIGIPVALLFGCVAAAGVYIAIDYHSVVQRLTMERALGGYGDSPDTWAPYYYGAACCTLTSLLFAVAALVPLRNRPDVAAIVLGLVLGLVSLGGLYSAWDLSGRAERAAMGRRPDIVAQGAASGHASTAALCGGAACCTSILGLLGGVILLVRRNKQ